MHALGNGGADAIDNYQYLCRDCHLEKTEGEKEKGYDLHCHESRLNDDV